MYVMVFWVCYSKNNTTWVVGWLVVVGAATLLVLDGRVEPCFSYVHRFHEISVAGSADGGLCQGVVLGFSTLGLMPGVFCEGLCLEPCGKMFGFSPQK